ncbi:MAG: pyruvate kinase, partial [Kocuria sp.]|nr:pyruvate kinase [Kocuria sp.]
MRRAKIVSTLGPALSSYEKVSEAISAGLNVARLNMSHGDHDVHIQNYDNVRRAAADLD